MSIKQAKLIVTAHKHNLLNSFCNNGYVYIKQHENSNQNQSINAQITHNLIYIPQALTTGTFLNQL